MLFGVAFAAALSAFTLAFLLPLADKPSRAIRFAPFVVGSGMGSALRLECWCCTCCST